MVRIYDNCRTKNPELVIGAYLKLINIYGELFCMRKSSKSID